MTGAPIASRYDAVVIGAGSNGLVAALALARAGKRVIVVDSAESAGERSRAYEFAPGFRSAPFALDGGWLPPSVARGIGMEPPARTMPQFSVSCAIESGKFFALPADVARAAAAIEAYSDRDAMRWRAFTSRLRALCGFLEALYERPAPDVAARSIGDIAALLGLGKTFRSLGREGMTELLRVLPMAVQDFLDDEFESEVLKAAIGASAVRDLRQGPRSGGTTFVLLHYLAGAPLGSVRSRGWWHEGPDAFTRAATALATERGVTIRMGASVARVLVRDDAVAGVVLTDAEEIFANTVISTADPARTLLHLVDPVWLDPEFIHAVRNIKFRGCTAMVQYAVDRLPDVPGLDGVVSLSPSLDHIEHAYDAAKYGTASDHPHVELTVPTLRWPQLAPDRKHIVVARAQFAPYHLHHAESWDASHAAALGDAVTARIVAMVPGFADSVLHRSVLTPSDIEMRYGVTDGAVTQGELTLDQILFMRPVAGWSRYAMPVRGLYIGGAGAHPGPGIVGGAGWLAAQRVLKDGPR